jgi:hypothetical protein
MSKKGQRQRRRLQQSAPPSGQKPKMNLAPRDLKAMAEEVARYHAKFHDLFQRREQREWSECYWRGQVADLERNGSVIQVMLCSRYPGIVGRNPQPILGRPADSYERERCVSRVWS